MKQSKPSLALDISKQGSGARIEECAQTHRDIAMPATTKEYRDCIDGICGDYDRDGAHTNLADNAISNFVEDYSDQFSFLLELIQNAVDSAATGCDVQVKFALKLHEGHWVLIASNNGRPFEITDIERICGINKKPKGTGKIGYKGLGFKTVMLITDNPQVFSINCQFEFNKTLHPQYNSLWIAIPHWVDRSSAPDFIPSPEKWVTFLLPIRRQDVVTELSEKLDSFRDKSASILLFLDDLDELSVENDFSGKHFSLRCTNDSHPLLRTLALTDTEKDRILGQWVVTHFPYDARDESLMTTLSADAINEYTKKRRCSPKDLTDFSSGHPIISLAFRALIENGSLRFLPDRKGIVCAFFPVTLESDGSGLRFTVQSDFLTTQNRERLLPNSVWNQWIMDNMPAAMASAVRQLRNHLDLRMFIYESMPLEDEGKSAFANAIHKLLKTFLRKACVILTDRPAPDDWVTPENALWIEDTKLRDLLTSDDLPFLGKGELAAVSSEVKNDDANRMRPGYFLGPKGVNVSKLNKQDIITALQNQAWLRTKAESVEWFEKLFEYLANGLSDANVKSLSSVPIIPTTTPGKLARVDDVFISINSSILFSELAFVHERLSDNKTIRRLLIGRFRIPEGSYENLIAKVVAMPPDSENEGALREHVQLAKAYYDASGCSPNLDREILAKLRMVLKLQAKDETWHHIRDLHIAQDESKGSRSYPALIPNDAEAKSWVSFFLWLGVSEEAEMTSGTPKGGVAEPSRTDSKMTDLDTPKPTVNNEQKNPTVSTPTAETQVARQATPDGKPGDSGAVQLTGCTGEALAFHYIKKSLLKSFLNQAAELVEDQRDHFIIQGNGRKLAEGHWPNGNCLESETNFEGGQHYDFQVSQEDGGVDYYEVKATHDAAHMAQRNGGDLFQLTVDETAFARQHGSRYHIVRVYGAPRRKEQVQATGDSEFVLIDNPFGLMQDGTLGIRVRRLESGGYAVHVTQKSVK